ncbi:MAG: hypothetical protein AB7P52_09135 [Alphaproteobacteria bacterium]
MCLLCSSLIDARHWSDGERDETARRRERRRRRLLLAAVLGHYGLTLKPWGGEGYLLATAHGATELAGDLSDLWAAVERATGGRCDPFDPGLIAALSGDGEPSR